jgi:hypothetical protein
MSRIHGFMHSGVLSRNHSVDGEVSLNIKRLREQISRKSEQGDIMRWRWIVDSIMLCHLDRNSCKKSWTSPRISLDTRSKGVIVKSLKPRTVVLCLTAGNFLPRLWIAGASATIAFGSSNGPFEGPVFGTPLANAIARDPGAPTFHIAHGREGEIWPALIRINMTEECSRLDSEIVNSIAQFLWKVAQAETGCLAGGSA